jgi:hypothetical protein
VSIHSILIWHYLFKENKKKSKESIISNVFYTINPDNKKMKYEATDRAGILAYVDKI